MVTWLYVKRTMKSLKVKGPIMVVPGFGSDIKNINIIADLGGMSHACNITRQISFTVSKDDLALHFKRQLRAVKSLYLHQ